MAGIVHAEADRPKSGERFVAKVFAARKQNVRGKAFLVSVSREEGVLGGDSRARRALEAERRRLEALSPMAVLGRGYSLARDEQGAVVTSIAGLSPGRRLTTVFADGSVLGEVLEVKAARASDHG